MAYEDDIRSTDRVEDLDATQENGAELHESDLTEDEMTNPDPVETSRGFHESLPGSTDTFEEDFDATLDPEENPHIGDQLDDPGLQREAENDYR